MKPSLSTHLSVALVLCGLSFSVHGEDKLLSELKERLSKERTRLKSRPKSKPAPAAAPMTWEQFLAAKEGEGATRSELAKRFRIADANHDEILTPAEIEAHRAAAAKNKLRKN